MEEIERLINEYNKNVRIINEYISNKNQATASNQSYIRRWYSSKISILKRVNRQIKNKLEIIKNGRSQTTDN